MLLKQSSLFALTIALCAIVQITMSQTTTQTPAPFPKSVITLMASREERYHHFLWHNIRDGWNRFSAETQKQLTDLKWNPPRPSRRYDANGNPIAITDNNSGEDFLYMHRQMVKKVNDLLVQTKDPYGKLKSWTKIPAPGDKDFPVPPEYTIKGNTATSNTIKSYKSLDYYNTKIKPMEDLLTNPVELRKMTLGQIGSRIETTIHNWLHLRFSNESTYGYRPGTTNALPNFDKKWDDPRYDWLGDTYSSHVNPVFWGLHGWVNDRVEAWARANNLTVITWRGIWQGGPMKNLNSIIGTNAKRVAMPTISRSDSNTNLRGGATSTDDDNVMEKVLNILRNEKESSFADKVKIDMPLPKPKTTASRSKTR